MKNDKLNEAIKTSGMRKTFLSKMLGLSHAGFYNKLNGATEFTASEIKVLARLLNLDSEQIISIFFS